MMETSEITSETDSSILSELFYEWNDYIVDDDDELNLFRLQQIKLLLFCHNMAVPFLLKEKASPAAEDEDMIQT